MTFLSDEPTFPAWTSLDEDTRKCLREDADKIKWYLNMARDYERLAQDCLGNLQLDNDKTLGIWCLFESYEKTALKRTNH